MDHFTPRGFRFRTFVLSLHLLVFISTLCAQDSLPDSSGGTETLKKLTLEELSKIELTTVSKESTDAFRTPAAISVLTRQDIAHIGATTLPDLLRFVPGVEVAQISADKWAIGIRGFEGYLSKSVLVLIDGRSVYTPLFAGVYWEMQDTLIEDIERIEVIRGPGGTIWGTNAVNGVINIITRNAKDTRGSLATAAGGNVEQGSLSARYGAGDTNLAYRFWGKGFTRAAQHHSDGDKFDDWRRGQVGFRMDWTPSMRDSITLSGGGYGMVAGSRLGISSYSPPALTSIDDNADMFGQNIETAWRRTFRSGSDIQVRAYFDRTDRRDLNYREIRDTVDFDFIHHVPLGKNDIIWGAGIHSSPSHFFQTVPTVDFSPGKQTYTVYSGFGQDSIPLYSRRLTAIIGTKLEHNSFSGFEIQPSVRLAWTPTQQQTFWAATTRAVRTPSRIEEGFKFTAFAVPALSEYVRLIGDGQFKSEQLFGYELGYRAYLKKHGFISISGFYNRYNDLLSVENQLVFTEEAPPPPHLILPLFLRNGMTADTRGFEIASLWDATSWWRLKSSYSYMHLTARRDPASDDASTENQFENDSPQHKLVVQSLFNLPAGFDIDLAFRYVSAIPDQKVTSYSTGDVHISKRISREFELSAIGQNILQSRHAEYGSLPGGVIEIRRSAFLKLTWTK